MEAARAAKVIDVTSCGRARAWRLESERGGRWVKRLKWHGGRELCATQRDVTRTKERRQRRLGWRLIGAGGEQRGPAQAGHLDCSGLRVDSMLACGQSWIMLQGQGSRAPAC